MKQKNEDQEIAAALKRCRAAFKKHPDAKWAWFCHHEKLCEELREPAEVRIQYILDAKPKHEQATRFNNFRPVLDEKKLTQARAEYERVTSQALAQYERVTSPARAEYERVKSQAWAEYERVTSQALAQYERVTSPARAQYKRVTSQAFKTYLRKIYRQDVPLGTWNGKSIFKK